MNGAGVSTPDVVRPNSCVGSPLPWREPAQGLVIDDGGDPRNARADLRRLAVQQRQVARGEPLYRQGDPMCALYEVLEGQFKSDHVDARGRHQITSFNLTGELLGLDGLGTGRHCVDVVALETACVRLFPYSGVKGLLQESAAFRVAFNKIMGHEIVRDQAMMLLLGTMAAEGRIAAFVIDLGLRLSANGRSAPVLLLHMSRLEIGSYLGLTLETVSRTLSKLRRDGVIDIDRRQLQVTDAPALRLIAQRGGGRCGPMGTQQVCAASRVEPAEVL